MLAGKRILAVVPARSGSKGIPNKNLARVRGRSLIGWAGVTLREVTSVDERVISTDSRPYAEEAIRHGLEAPFMRPAELSTDEATAVATVTHALLECERHYRAVFDIVLIIEPTSPLRTHIDIERTAQRLIDERADSVVTVSAVPPKFHPLKLLTVSHETLGFFADEGRELQRRQDITGQLFWRNGVCYAITRDCLLHKERIFAERTFAEVITHPVVNIDEPLELAYAECLMDSVGNELGLT